MKTLTSAKRALGAKEADVKEKAHECGHLELELESARAAISTGEMDMQDFVVNL